MAYPFWSGLQTFANVQRVLAELAARPAVFRGLVISAWH